MKSINPEVFRAYDIRGIVDHDFDDQCVENLGRAMGAYFIANGHVRALLAHDCRHSSPRYQELVANGLAATGVDVVLMGLAATPVFYWAVKKLGLAAGAVITASHNPPRFNGFKVVCGQSTIHTHQIQELRRIMESGDFPTGEGIISEISMDESYVEELAASAPLAAPIKIVVDGGNGSGGPVCAELLRRAGAEVVELFCEPDGDFPNHHPDPVVEANMSELKARVVAEKAHFGVGLDGDADRVGVVDEAGNLIYGDQLLAVFARSVLAENPGAVILGEVKCSHLMYRDIEAHGGRAVMGVTGHSVMKARMRETGALLAGEMSGHMFFADRYHGFDDGPYAALRLAEIVAKTPLSPLSDHFSDWPATHNTPEIRMDCPEKAKFKVVEAALAHFRADAPKGAEVVDVDGMRLVLPDGWALIRASNTQPALVLRFEAESAARLKEIRALVESPLAGWIRDHS